ncbi:DUF6924 domain-containing protein [Nocardia aurantia]|uniref:Bulb-type lectin domain-containing protein n=1 Tax=Nocardia aurantia TaxID=2585199 RepID=A0A7K0DZE3_9NOCA|nr:hypothetical protein [Nocardia aurantia]MQY30928.1 hypothetical protein [Nocardia aurantia]
MRPVSDEVFVFRMWRRVWGSPEWVSGPRLLLYVGDGDPVAPAQVSWTTREGIRSALGFAPDMTSCYGRREVGGAVQEMRGELDERSAAESARGYEFDTETAVAGGWEAAGLLRLLIDDGDGGGVNSVEWSGPAGDVGSVALLSRDVGGLIEEVWASAEYREAGEVAVNLVRATTDKWLAAQDRATLEFRFTAPVSVDRYELTSAGDCPDRDPSAWTLRGSVDGQRWRTLDIRSGQSFEQRHRARAFSIARTEAWSHYRLDITGNHGAPELQLETVRFLVTDGCAGYRRRAGAGPVPFRGTVVAAGMSLPSELSGPFSETTQALGPLSAARFTPMVTASFAPVAAPADEGADWQPGGSWLPLGGSLSMQSLTSPSGRFTLLHGPYGPCFALRDNLTRERVWIGDAPDSHMVCLGPDGDLVAWGHRGNRLWSTGTAWLGVRRLEVRDSGEVALTDVDGKVVWSSGIPELPFGDGPRPVPRGATLRRGESLYGQTLTSADGSTVLCHDGRVVRIIMHGSTSHWDRFPEAENELSLDADGFLRLRTLDGAVLEQICGPGAELVVERGAVELRDEAGAVVWASTRSQRPGPVREPGLAQDDVLVNWLDALTGGGHRVAVARDTTPQDVLARIGVTPVAGTWRELRRHRDTTHPDGGSVVAAVAVGSDVLLVSDDPELPVPALAPWVAAVQQPAGSAFPTFSLHRDGELVSEIREYPSRHKGTKVPEVAAALAEVVHPLHIHTLLFRTAGVVPGAAALGGELLGGVLAPRPAAEPTPPAESPLLLEGWQSMDAVVVRTDFSDPAAWDRVIRELRSPWFDDDPVEPYLISDPRLTDAPAEQVVREVRGAQSAEGTPGAVFIADSITMREPGNPLLAVTTEWDGRAFEDDEDEYVTQFRLLPDAAVEISTNLDLGNMDFADFAGEGVYERTA